MSSLDRVYDEVSKLETFSPIAFALAALAGLLLALTPTVLALAPALMGYLARESDISRWKAGARSSAFVLVTATTFGLYGLVFALAGSWLAPLFGRNGYLVAGVVLLLLGLAMLGKVRLKAPVIDAPERRVNSFVGAYFLGIPFGLVGTACPCSIPVVLAMLLYAGSVGSPWFGAALLFVFALVRGLPLLLAGMFAGWLKEFKGIARLQPRLEKASGIVLIILGVVFIAQRFAD